MADQQQRSGFWSSPVSAESTLSNNQMQYAEWFEDKVTWVEARPKEQGRRVLVIQEEDGAIRTITPDGFNLRTRVHEYGGRAHAFLGDQVAFVNFPDQAIYLQPMSGGPAERLTAPAPPGEEWRFADLISLPNGDGLLAVCEHHAPGREARNTLVHLAITPLAKPTIIHEGSDFIAMPSISSDSQQVAWIQWDHPFMQWDCSVLWQGTLHTQSGTPRLSDSHQVAGGPGKSVWQPMFLGDGGLTFVMDDENDAAPESGTWQLYLRRNGANKRLTHGHAEFAEPFWVTGSCRVVELNADALLAIGTDELGETLVEVPLDGSGASSPLARLPVMQQLTRTPDGVLLSGRSHTEPFGVYRWNQGVGLQRIAGPSCPLAPEQISHGTLLQCTARDGDTIFAWYYPPLHRHHQLVEGERPPLIVKAHGGPTLWAKAGFDLSVQYWTSRGFAVVDVNYRGSSGFGRVYRQALVDRWGELDIDDVVDVVDHVVESGHAAQNGIFIRGGSAGGYVVLRVLTRNPEIWAGGACHYGIGNLGTLAATTHKFESHYLCRLLGETWETGKDARPGNPYHDRSPIFFIDKMQAPVILFQGSDDRVVPPEVSQEMEAQLKAAGIPAEYHEYPGEGHGFRMAKNRVHALENELRFFQDILTSPSPRSIPG